MAAPVVCTPVAAVSSWPYIPIAAPAPASPQLFGSQAVSSPSSRRDVQFEFNIRAHMYDFVARIPEHVVHEDQISLRTEGRFLTIAACRGMLADPETCPVSDASLLFKHSVKFPKDVDPDGITIKLKKGVLRVQLPRRRNSLHYRASDQ